MQASTPTIPEKKPDDDKEKDKPKKRVFATTLPPKTGAMYKEAYKEKLRKEKEEATPTSKPEKLPLPMKAGIASTLDSSSAQKTKLVRQ